MKTLFYFFLFISCISSAQNQEYLVLDQETKMPIESASVYLLQVSDTMAILNSSDRGTFKILQSFDRYNRIYITHLNYKPSIVSGLDLEKDTLYLEKNNYELDELEIKSKKKIKWNPLPFSVNLSHEQQVATLFLSEKDVGLQVKKIKAQVIDLLGVKNLKYLPFKLQLREVNPEDNLPGKIVFESAIISKKDAKKWYELDISSLQIIMPANGLFIVFEVLDQKKYSVIFINSRVGIISAVPQLKTKRKNLSSSISYIFRKCYEEDCLEKWELQKEYYFNLQLGF
jgi:hypothetical protein